MTGVQSFTILNRGAEPLAVSGVNVVPFDINTNIRSAAQTAPRTYIVKLKQSGADVFHVNFEGPGQQLNVIPGPTPAPAQISAVLAWEVWIISSVLVFLLTEHFRVYDANLDSECAI